MFAKEAGDGDSASLRLKIALGDAVLVETPVAFSFQGKAKGRVLVAINALAIPGPGVLSFSLVSDGGSQIGVWEATVELLRSGAVDCDDRAAIASKRSNGGATGERAQRAPDDGV